MCLINKNIDGLVDIREKAHVLKKGYKVVYNLGDGDFRSIFNSYRWKEGWNHAIGPKGGIMRKKTPYAEKSRVNNSIHAFVTLASARDYCDYDETILPVWYYCDEVTGYERITKWNIGSVITVSRVLVKKIPQVGFDRC